MTVVQLSKQTIPSKLFELSSGFFATELAIQKLREAFLADDTSPWGIRIGIRGGGCKGFSYTLDFIQEVDIDIEEDFQVLVDDLNFAVDVFSAEYLKLTTIDYLTTLSDTGFKFKSSKAGSTQCGCGSSFSG